MGLLDELLASWDPERSLGTTGVFPTSLTPRCRSLPLRPLRSLPPPEFREFREPRELEEWEPDREPDRDVERLFLIQCCPPGENRPLDGLLLPERCWGSLFLKQSLMTWPYFPHWLQVPGKVPFLPLLGHSTLQWPASLQMKQFPGLGTGFTGVLGLTSFTSVTLLTALGLLQWERSEEWERWEPW